MLRKLRVRSPADGCSRGCGLRPIRKARVASIHRLSDKVWFCPSWGGSCQILGCVHTKTCKKLITRRAKQWSPFSLPRATYGGSPTQTAGGVCRSPSRVRSSTPREVGFYGGFTLHFLVADVLTPFLMLRNVQGAFLRGAAGRGEHCFHLCLTFDGRLLGRPHANRKMKYLSRDATRLSHVLCCQYFLLSLACLFIFLMVSFDEKRLLILRKLKLSIYFLLWLLLFTSC